MAVKIPLGNIVLVRQVPDKLGGNHKDRFVVLVRDYNDGDAEILGVAITGSFNLPLPSTSVNMKPVSGTNGAGKLSAVCAEQNGPPLLPLVSAPGNHHISLDFRAWFNPAVFGVTRLWRQVFNLPGPQPASWETCRHSCYPALNHADFRPFPRRLQTKSLTFFGSLATTT